MKLAYPASHRLNTLNHSLLSLKIARHSPCLACNNCTGLHPRFGLDIVLDEINNEPTLGGLDQYGSDDDDDTPLYLDSCACGHSVRDHGADESTIGRDEFARRSRVAVRLDELLQVSPDAITRYF